MTPLARLAALAAANPAFLASRFGPDVGATAARLGVSVEAVCHLYLCRVPATEADVGRIAGRWGVSAGELRAVLGW